MIGNVRNNSIFELKRGLKNMPFVKANIEAEKLMIDELIHADTELKNHVEEWDKEYEFRKKLVMARKQSGLIKFNIRS